MVWIRYARIRALWRCYTTRGYSTKHHVVGVAIRDEYEKRPIEDIDIWARRLGDFVVDKMCTNSCESLSTSVFCDKTSLEVEVIYTSETLVVKPVVKKEVVPPVAEIEELPKFEKDIVELLEERLKEATSADEADAIKEEINNIYRRRGLPVKYVIRFI